MSSKLLTLLFTLSVALTRPVRAEDVASPGPTRARFSDARRIMVAGSVGGFWGSRTLHHQANWSANFSPSATYFLRDRVGLGVAPSIGKGNDTDGFRVRDIGIGVHGVFDVPLAERISWLVLPTLGYNHHKRDSPPFDLRAVGQITGAEILQSSTQQSFRFTMFVPIAVHVSSSVVIGLGPYFTYDRLIGRPTTHYAAPDGSFGSSNQNGVSPFLPPYNNFYVGVSSFIGASF